jgi:hypothetical protein
VYVLRIQAMNPSIGHTIIPINYQTTWSQLVTPIVPIETSMLPTSTYPMWYNVILPFVPLDPSLYLAYPTRIKGLDCLIFRNYTSYVLGNVYPILEQAYCTTNIFTILCRKSISYSGSTSYQ